MAKKMSKRLMAISSAAVLAVYAIGYTATEPAAASLAAASSDGAGGQSLASPPSISARPQVGAARLKDGTYTGAGWSRRGGVQVSVTIKNGRIVSAPITGVTTHYSQNVISGLPGEVVSLQGSQVDLVSGATDSSMAYQQAVAQALAQAGAQAATDPSSTIVVGPVGGAPNAGGARPAGQGGSFRRPRPDFQASDGYGRSGNGGGSSRFGAGGDGFGEDD
ncbi:MAG: FMN-binding protein [Chloroflexota bacterium]|nr:FMN-binding protein [Chloroflexota bacterium]